MVKGHVINKKRALAFANFAVSISGTYIDLVFILILLIIFKLSWNYLTFTLPPYTYYRTIRKSTYVDINNV